MDGLIFRVNDMIDRNTILSLNYYKYDKAYTGSLGEKRYRIKRGVDISYPEDLSPDATEDEKKKAAIKDYYLSVAIWEGPFCYEKTDSAIMQNSRFPFDDEGYEALLAYLNEHLVP